MKKIYFILIFCFVSSFSRAQVSITNIGTAVTENFDAIGSAAASTLPAGFKFGTDWALGTTVTTQAAGTSGTGVLTGSSSGGFYNFANGETASSTDRAIGILSSSGFTSPRSIIVKITNNTGSTISDLTISFDYEKYRTGLRAFDWTFFHGNTSTAGTAASSGAQSYIADAANAVVNPPTTLSKIVILSGLSIANGSDYYLRWTYTGVGGSTNAQGLAIDNFSVTAASGGTDVIPPTVSTLTPADNAINVSVNTNLKVLFSESVVKGAGNIVIKKLSDNSIVQTIDVSNVAVSIVGMTATITISPLANVTDYYVEIASGAFTDAALNPFAGISGATSWNFTTAPIPAAGIIGNNYSFTNCAATFNNEGWSQYNVTGPSQFWSCVSAGRTDANALQMNGFSGSAIPNEDWLISPGFDLTTATLPALTFYSRGEFTGNNLTLKVSTNYVDGTDPNTATWVDLNGNFPTGNTWTISDNIDLSAYPNSNVRVAWIYTSTNTAAKRWSIDDVIILTNTPCPEPTAQPTNLNLTATATTVTGTFTPVVAPTTIQNYLIVRSTSATLSQLPVDGVNYTPGQVIESGNGVAVGISSDGNFTNTVSPSTQYFYFIFALNDQDCAGGPNYNQTAPLTGDVTTPALAACSTPATPTLLTLTPANNSISGSFTASGADRYLTVVSSSSSIGASPVNGAIYTAGQSFGSGTIVSYAPATSFTATGLTVATPYYLYVFAANDACTGEPFYSITSLDGTTTTTNNTTGIPVGYYDAAAGLTCQPLKTALKNIITNGFQSLSYTPGLWNLYLYSDMRRNDANTADIIWDMYSDNPSGAEPYVFPYGPMASGGKQCGTYSVEGDCYNREHSTPQSWFNQISPMVSDAHHIFPTDGKVNALRSNYPYGEVTNITPVSGFNNPSLNGSKLGTGSGSQNFGYSGTVFEPINEYKGDLARAGLYMAVRYEDEIIAQNWSSLGTGNQVFLSETDQADAAKRRLQIYDTWQLNLLIKWHTNDIVSQKEIDRNNAIYYQSVNTTTTGDPKAQSNRNPFVDHPEYVAVIFQCTGVVPVTITDFVATKQKNATLLQWYATYETNFKVYEIERSTNGTNFNKIGEIRGQNLANYSFADNNLPTGSIVYYRLKMVDIDGSFKMSKTIAVKLNNNFSNALVYPNPAMGQLQVKLITPLTTNTNLVITDITGRIVKQQSLLKGQLSIDVNVQSLPAGRYLVKINDQQSVINQSFIVIK